MYKIDDFFLCPFCHSALSSRQGLYVCSKCRYEFKIINNIPVFCEIQTYVPKKRSKGLKILLKKIYVFINPPSISRITLDNQLIPILKNIKTNDFILDIGSKKSPYRKYINSKYYYSTDVDYSNDITFVSNIYNLPLKENSFDIILFTEVLEHLSEPGKAIENIYKVLKPNGKMVLTTRFCYPYHPDPKDFFRFTKDGLVYLTQRFSEVEIIGHGSSMQLLFYILSKNKFFRVILLPVSYLIAKLSRKRESKFAFGYIVIAKK
jgi:SAM-dependent methyltransferase